VNPTPPHCPARSGAPVRLAEPIAERYRALRSATDTLWIDLANTLGFDVARMPGAFVAYDGTGTIAVAPYEDLDDDDCLAQIVLHELCHHWVQGPQSRHALDWGLSNTDAADEAREHLALRLQAALLAPTGLARVLVPTTDFRAYYEQLLDEGADAVRDACVHAPDGEPLRRLQAALAQTAQSAAACGFRVVPSDQVCYRDAVP
jgi:hypothetical protein